MTYASDDDRDARWVRLPDMARIERQAARLILDPRTDVLELANPVEYANSVELGTAGNPPAGMVRMTASRFAVAR